MSDSDGDSVRSDHSPRYSPRYSPSSPDYGPNGNGEYAEYEEDRLVVARARKVERFLSQPFFVAEIFTGSPGKYVSLADTIKGFNMILDGELDELPEQAFYLVGDIDEAIEKAKSLKG